MKTSFLRFSLFLLLAGLLFSCKKAPEKQTEIAIIPHPAKVDSLQGNFLLKSQTRIFLRDTSPEIKQIAGLLSEKIQTATGFELETSIEKNPGNQANYIFLELLPDSGWHKEQYRLKVDKNSIWLSASQGAGLFYAVQTLRQLLPPEIESKDKYHIDKWLIPCVKIQDKPRFSWRGMNFDCSRHFMEKEFVKRYIDLLAYHKMNVLHWHITDDQGWRIEIKKYPKLTEIGAWRKNDDGTKYGGFYTQEDIKEIVAYAKTRYITVVPEIELPGHCTAALAAYPEVSCTGGPFEVETRWGVFKEVYCAGNDRTFEFLQGVLDEVVELFPSKYIHIGGDEVPKFRWEQCPKCQKRIKNEKLKDEHELQSYFIKRIENYLNSKDRQIIGWDEILEGGLAQGATVQSWRGFEGAIEAARSGHHAIVSPTSHAYFDYSVGRIDLEKVYSFEPVPEELSPTEKKHIIGGEANMWSERAPQHLIDNRMFPRMLAMAEVLWTPKNKRDYANFHQRVNHHYQRLDLIGVTYGPEDTPVRFEPQYNEKDNSLKIKLIPGQEGFTLRYTTDGTQPTAESAEYTQPIEIHNETELKAGLFRNGELRWGVHSQTCIPHKAIGKTVKLTYLPNPSYQIGGGSGLVDGLRAPVSFRDGFWQGYEKTDFEAIVDMQQVLPIKRIAVGFLQDLAPWIFLPPKITFSISKDGENYATVATFTNTTPKNDTQVFKKDFEKELQDQKARYIKVSAQNFGKCPLWHPAAGSATWIFVDEIIVE